MEAISYDEKRGRYVMVLDGNEVAFSDVDIVGGTSVHIVIRDDYRDKLERG